MLALALFAAALASVVNLAFSSSVKLDLLISSIFLAKASSIALLASSLVAEVSGTLTLLSVSTPFSLAVFTASLVVALLMLALALLHQRRRSPQGKKYPFGKHQRYIPGS